MIFSDFKNAKIFCCNPETGEVIPMSGMVSVSDIEISADDTTETYKHFCSKSVTFQGKISSPLPLALYYFLVHGNDLYIKFPKKLRRKRKKHGN